MNKEKGCLPRIGRIWKTKKSGMLLGNTHTHSTKSDGREHGRVMIEEYKRKGYDFVIMTDHRNRERVYTYPKVEGIIVIDGCEVSSGEHYIFAKAGNTTLKIKNHPGRYNDPIHEVEQWNNFEVTEHARLQKKYFRCKRGYPIFSDDAHHRGAVGRAGILVESEPDPECILIAIKQGRYRLWANRLAT